MNAGEHADKKQRTLGKSLLSIGIMVALVVVLTVLLRTFVFVPYEIPSGSMEETILTGDMVFSEKVSYYMRDPEQGDIITFADPTDASRTLIKRVVATGGQTVDLQNGKVLVDGVVLDEPYTLGKVSEAFATTAPGVDIAYPYTVPEGHVWVMGDNRTSSQDSRYFGAVDIESVTGRAAMIYWPIKDIGLLS